MTNASERREIDLSPYGVADLISSFLDTLDLKDVTIVGNDSGGAISQVLVTRHPKRIGRLVLTNCDTHENFPPGIFKAMPPIAKLPHGMELLLAPFRIGAIARPLLLVWAPGDRYFPIEYAERLAASTPNAHIVEIPDAKTFVALDQPRRLADVIAEFGSFERQVSAAQQTLASGKH